MNTATKVVGIAALVYLGNKLIGLARKAKNIQDNISVSTAFKSAGFKGLSPSLTFTITITNLSGINITVKNLFSKIFMVSNGKPVEVSYSNVEPVIHMKTGGSVSFDTTFQVNGIGVILNLLKTQELKVVTYYDVLEQRLEYANAIDVKTIAQKVKSAVGLSGPRVIGYIPGQGNIYQAMGMI